MRGILYQSRSQAYIKTTENDAPVEKKEVYVSFKV